MEIRRMDSVHIEITTDFNYLETTRWTMLSVNCITKHSIMHSVFNSYFRT